MNPEYYATVQNQYGLLIGDAVGATPEEASRLAAEKADQTIRSANPNWKWRKVKRHVSIYPYTTKTTSIK